MPPPDTLDPASLDRFIDSLLAAGFEPTGDQRSWRGPIDPALVDLTTATHMRVVIKDGWPWVPPRVYVSGLPLGRHRNADGDVCLWELGDPDLEWLTWDGVSRRIALWAAEAQGYATEDDPGLDPHLVFTGATLGLATIDLAGRAIRDWDTQPVRATATDWGLEIGEGPLAGLWITRERPKSPPQTLDDLRAQLRHRQRDALGAALESVGRDGGTAFLVFAWDTPVGPNLLVLGLQRSGTGEIVAWPYEAARTDRAILLARAGHDAERLARKRVAIFGIGAVGSRIADLLVRQGLGTLDLYDSQRLRPGDVVRHVASNLFVGGRKTHALWLLAKLAAPWAEVSENDATWSPSSISSSERGTDLVVDAVGLVSFTEQLSRICQIEGVPMVSVALYRSGAIGRVRLQVTDGPVPITDRPGDARFPKVPPGPDDGLISWETGCADPIVESSPIAAASIAAAAARITTDLLASRFVADMDQIEVYEPLDVPAPFDAVGTHRIVA